MTLDVTDLSVVDDAVNLTRLADRSVYRITDISANLTITADLEDFVIGDEIILLMTAIEPVDFIFSDENFYTDWEGLSPNIISIFGRVGTRASMVFVFDGERFVSSVENC